MCDKLCDGLLVSDTNKLKLLLAAIIAGTIPAGAVELNQTLGAESAYNIVPVSQAEATEDSIVTYTYENGETVPHYYNIKVKDNVTGSSTRFQNEKFWRLMTWIFLLPTRRLNIWKHLLKKV